MAEVTTPMAPPRDRVPRLWSGATMILMATGPSLCLADIDRARSSGHPILVINDAFKVCPGADILYAADGRWWQWNADIPDQNFPAWRFSIDPVAREWRADVHVLTWTGRLGLEKSAWGVRKGGHGGYQAINVAAHTGAKRLLLLGYDLQPSTTDPGCHHSSLVGEHPDGSHPHYVERVKAYDSLVAPLAELQIEVLNVSRETAITAFPRGRLEDALSP